MNLIIHIFKKEMIINNYNLGGEQAGHIILSDYNSTGDGTVTALQVLRIMKETKKKLSELNDQFTPYPQILINLKVKEKDQLVTNILNLLKKHKVNLHTDFSILVNSGPGSFSSMRISLAVAKGIKLSKKIKLFGFKDYDLGQFCLANIEFLIKNELLQKNLIKPLYLS